MGRHWAHAAPAMRREWANASGERGTGRSLPRSELDIRAACNAGRFGPFATLVPAAPGLPPTFEVVVCGNRPYCPSPSRSRGTSGRSVVPLAVEKGARVAGSARLRVLTAAVARCPTPPSHPLPNWWLAHRPAEQGAGLRAGSLMVYAMPAAVRGFACEAPVVLRTDCHHKARSSFLA